MSTSQKHPILIVDDEPDVLYSLKGLLRREFELFTAESGEQALEILRKHPIHVVMTDQRMPGMTGVELMGETRASHPEAIRIVFTGYADIKAVVEAINTGELYRYITKPWDPDELIQTLHQAAAYYNETVLKRQLLSEVPGFLDDVVGVLESSSADDGARAKLIQQAYDLRTRLAALTASRTE